MQSPHQSIVQLAWTRFRRTTSLPCSAEKPRAKRDMPGYADKAPAANRGEYNASQEFAALQHRDFVCCGIGLRPIHQFRRRGIGGGHRQPRYLRCRQFAHAADGHLDRRPAGNDAHRHPRWPEQAADLPGFADSWPSRRRQQEFRQQHAEPAQFRWPAHPGAAGWPSRRALQLGRHR